MRANQIASSGSRGLCEPIRGREVRHVVEGIGWGYIGSLASQSFVAAHTGNGSADDNGSVRRAMSSNEQH